MEIVAPGLINFYMYKGKKILCIIPARGGSKRLPGKHTRLLHGQPLISYAIKATQDSKYVDEVVVSTDDQEIVAVAKKYGASVPFIRPKHLARDTSELVPVLQHAVAEIEKEGAPVGIVILVQPTSPGVLAKDIDAAVKKMMSEGVDSCVSLTTIVDRPEWMFRVTQKKRLAPFMKATKLRSQDLEVLYRVNGAVYVTTRDLLMKKNTLYVPDKCTYILMPHERSVDVDTLEDFTIAEALIPTWK